MRCLVVVAAAAGAVMGAPRDNTVCSKDLCDDTCILTNRKLDFPATTNATHGMHSVVTGTLSAEVSGATFELSASFMGVAVPVTPATGSVCGGPVTFDVSGLSTVVIDFSNGGTQTCPQAAGSASVTPTDVVSSSDPPMGKFLTNVVIKNGDGTLISSLQTQVGGCGSASLRGSAPRDKAPAVRAPRDNTVCSKDLCDDTCILTDRKLDFPATTNATHGMHSVVTGTLSKEVSGATFALSASFMGVAVPVTPATGSVCGGAVTFDVSGLSTVVIDFSNGGTQTCPQAAGSASVTPTDVVSSSDPPMGKFLTNVVITNGDGTLISSLQTQVGGC